MYAGSVGLDPAFTIHDREDSADLLNLVRHEQGLSEKAKRFPLKSTCLAIYSRAVNAAEALDVVLRKQFPWCAEWESDLRNLFDVCRGPSRSSTCSIAMTCCSIGAS
jgi:DNA helicase-2/ATP-dependent DNA helicase PcrA